MLPAVTNPHTRARDCRAPPRVPINPTWPLNAGAPDPTVPAEAIISLGLVLRPVRPADITSAARVTKSFFNMVYTSSRWVLSLGPSL